MPGNVELTPRRELRAVHRFVGCAVIGKDPEDPLVLSVPGSSLIVSLGAEGKGNCELRACTTKTQLPTHKWRLYRQLSLACLHLTFIDLLAFFPESDACV